MLINCKECGASFPTSPCRIKIGKRYCSIRCKSAAGPSDVARRNMSLAKIGTRPSMECMRGAVIANKGRKLSEEHRRRIGDGNRGKIRSEATRLLISSIQTGRKQSEETVRKRVAKNPRGADHPWWRGGITEEIRRIRNSFEYKIWRRAVFERDNYTCVLCLKRGGRLNADHIKRFSDYPELRFDVNNGRTLCELCHKKTDNYGRKSKHPEQQYAQLAPYAHQL